VTKNSLLTAPDGLRRIWFSLESPSQYFPPHLYLIPDRTHALGLEAHWLSLVNILLHTANALLLWRLLTELEFPARGWRPAFRVAPCSGGIMAWITERKNTLMAFFFLLTLLGWARFIDERNQQAIQRSRAHRKQRAKEVTQAGKIKASSKSATRRIGLPAWVTSFARCFLCALDR